MVQRLSPARKNHVNTGNTYNNSHLHGCYYHRDHNIACRTVSAIALKVVWNDL